mmetsp:Transcript_15407/g.22652  ORF Transcript_15407/g.22652 Transcript_15407/m.22652 type:complete len:183 (+) Transcript_15407:64-612(+)
MILARSLSILQNASMYPRPSLVRRSVHIESRMEQKGIVLPPPGAPKANYNMFCWNHDSLYLSGHLPITTSGQLITGRLGAELDLDAGYSAARWVGLNMISTLKSELGDLDRVDQIVKLFGIVNSTNDFTDHHLVMNGCSDVMMEVFGQTGYHARSAIGTNVLPLGIPVEVEMIVRIKADGNC